MSDLNDLLYKKNYTVQDIEKLLSLRNTEDVERLKNRANEILNSHIGDSVYYRGIVEFSNICALDCHYCGIRKSNKQVDRYSLDRETVVSSAKWCADQGYGSVVLQSGERRDPAFVDYVEDLIREIKKETRSEKLPEGVGITLSVGEQSLETYRRFFAAGAHRYLLRIETTNEELYQSLHPASQKLEERILCLDYLKEAGFQVGTGVMIGSPGQTTAMLARDILFFKEKDIDMIGMGPYLVHNQTPMASEGQMEKDELLQLSLNMIAVCRIVLKDVNIAATTALQAVVPDGRERGLSYGANVTMPNITPTEVRSSYKLYEGKPCMDEGRQECKSCLLGRVRSIGRDVAFDQWGDSKHYAARKAQLEANVC
ncbi:[FeFe] hydrogenase H-cluster radical SAM maturase HydE [Spirochaeta isovalerica]|uniref:Biotin synthase n=1 Tax=Spirochaeta isovalerica TaxID=150 RepID=A0A841RCC0_9SPIO|nr:[FeFe] hydrogenase H-cluster radical SAM maturase HydE [Spirochaeta isovalerica]MBB6481593.1 biotin synthase [Spirochaeta isovalerica]